MGWRECDISVFWCRRRHVVAFECNACDANASQSWYTCGALFSKYLNAKCWSKRERERGRKKKIVKFNRACTAHTKTILSTVSAWDGLKRNEREKAMKYWMRKNKIPNNENVEWIETKLKWNAACCQHQQQQRQQPTIKQIFECREGVHTERVRQTCSNRHSAIDFIAFEWCNSMCSLSLSLVIRLHQMLFPKLNFHFPTPKRVRRTSYVTHRRTQIHRLQSTTTAIGRSPFHRISFPRTIN